MRDSNGCRKAVKDFSGVKFRLQPSFDEYKNLKVLLKKASAVALAGVVDQYLIKGRASNRFDVNGNIHIVMAVKAGGIADTPDFTVVRQRVQMSDVGSNSAR